MAAGVVPETSIDTLLMYAYAQAAVERVKLEINQEVPNGESPTVVYKIQLKPLCLITWKAYKKAEQIKNGIIRKTALLGLAKAGAPLYLESEIKRLAGEYLPPKYVVKVEIQDS